MNLCYGSQTEPSQARGSKQTKQAIVADRYLDRFTFNASSIPPLYADETQDAYLGR